MNVKKIFIIVFRVCNMVARNIYTIKFHTETLFLCCGVQFVRNLRFIRRCKDSSIKLNHNTSPLSGDQANEITGCDGPKDTL
jgi:hypothetical protein